MSTVPTKKTTRIPQLGSVLTSTSETDKCTLCGNSFATGRSSTSTRKELPCMDSNCGPCAGMWRILSSTCPACYADFICPKLAGEHDRPPPPQLKFPPKTLREPSIWVPVSPKSQKHLNAVYASQVRQLFAARKLLLDGEHLPQEHHPLDLQTESRLLFRDRNLAFDGADADSNDNTISDPGSPIRKEDGETMSLSELSNQDLRDALMLANNRAGTNFNMGEIIAEIPLADLRTSTKPHLEERLSQLCVSNAADSGEEDAEDEGSLQANSLVLQQDAETGLVYSFNCLHCKKTFRTAAQLRQHMATHDVGLRTCSVCSQVLGSIQSRRTHESKHWETDSQRGERLR